MSASDASKEDAWLEKLSLDLNESNDTPPTLFCDNQGAIDLIHDHKFHLKAKHIDVRCNFIQNDMIDAGRLKVVHIPGPLLYCNIVGDCRVLYSHVGDVGTTRIARCKS
jgi:hypothetical protein